MSSQNDWSGLNALESGLSDIFVEVAVKLANIGEAYIKGGQYGANLNYGGEHKNWQNDTASLLASVTGYESTTGDYRANFGEDAWRRAQIEGSKKYPENTPEHYLPSEPEEIDTSDADATAILSTWTQYPDMGKDEDGVLATQVIETLQESADFMVQQFPRVFQDSVRYAPIPISPE